MKPVDEKACQFIREFAVEKAREVVEGATAIDFAYDAHDQVYMRCGDIQDGYSIEDYEDCVLLEDLKRLVESLDLVKKLGGIDKCEGYAQVCFFKNRDKYGNRIKQAIRDHESIYGVDDVYTN